jgi:dTDP-4-dehydrorhamnose reductase
VIRVAVLGSTGMLGHAVTTDLRADPRFAVLGFSRWLGSDRYIDALHPEFDGIHDMDYVINCIGIVWQAKNPNRGDVFYVNGVFPWRLQAHCAAVGAKLIHVSTDCVFSGKRGAYTEADNPDPTDDYGLSKVIGEPKDSMVLRTSVIGHELRTKRSLLEWAISNSGKQIDGYIDHVWNGVTSHEFASICTKIMMGGLWEPGIHHVFSTPITKHQLLRRLSDVLGLKLQVKPVETPTPVNRTLSTVKPLCSKLVIPNNLTMINDLRPAGATT